MLKKPDINAMQNGRQFLSERSGGLFGISFYMGLVKSPSTRDYWRSDEKVWRHLDFSDNNDKSTEGDKVKQIRPIIPHINFCYENGAEN